MMQGATMHEDMQVTEYMQEICNNMRVLLLSTIAGQNFMISHKEGQR